MPCSEPVRWPVNHATRQAVTPELLSCHGVRTHSASPFTLAVERNTHHGARNTPTPWFFLWALPHCRTCVPPHQGQPERASPCGPRLGLTALQVMQGRCSKARHHAPCPCASLLRHLGLHPGLPHVSQATTSPLSQAQGPQRSSLDTSRPLQIHPPVLRGSLLLAFLPPTQGQELLPGPSPP